MAIFKVILTALEDVAILLELARPPSTDPVIIAGQRALEGYARGPGINLLREATPVVSGRLRAGWRVERSARGREFRIYNAEPYAGVVFRQTAAAPAFQEAVSRFRRGAEAAVGRAMERELEIILLKR